MLWFLIPLRQSTTEELLLPADSGAAGTTKWPVMSDGHGKMIKAGHSGAMMISEHSVQNLLQNKSADCSLNVY